MADSFEIAYLYARVCGAFSSMYLGARGASLARESSLASIWKQYFDAEIPDKPEAWLLAALEHRVVGRSMERFAALAGTILESDEFMAALTAKHEISAIKGMLYRLAASEPKPEGLPRGSATIERALAAWPRLEEMFSGTDYGWIDEAALADIGAAENRLDRRYYSRLWAAVQNLPGKMRGNIPSLLLREISYQNLAWALRVKRYYGFGREKTRPLVVDIEGEDVTTLALSTFDLDIDNLDTFSAWPAKRLLAGQTSSRLDIPLLENRLQRELFALVRRSMHMYPFGYTPLYCYFKMLEAEESFVLGVLEGIRLKAPAGEMADLAWALAGDAS